MAWTWPRVCQRMTCDRTSSVLLQASRGMCGRISWRCRPPWRRASENCDPSDENDVAGSESRERGNDHDRTESVAVGRVTACGARSDASKKENRIDRERTKGQREGNACEIPAEGLIVGELIERRRYADEHDVERRPDLPLLTR